MNSGNLFAGLVKGYADTVQQIKQKQREDEFFKLQKRKFETDFKLSQMQQNAQSRQTTAAQSFLGKLTGSPAEQGFETVLAQGQGAPVPGMDLADLLASPEGQRNFLAGGLGTISDLQKIQKQNKTMQALESLGGESGMSFEPTSIFRSKATGDISQLRPPRIEIIEEVQPDGSKIKFRYNLDTKEKTPLTGGISELSPLDKQLTASELEGIPGSIPGDTLRSIASKGLTPQKQLNQTDAGRLAGIVGARDEVENLKNIIFKGGDVAKGDIQLDFFDFTSMGMGGLPNTKGRIYETSFRDAIDSVVRARTGAGAPESEMKNLLSQFMPTVFDKDDGKRDKVRRLEAFLNNTLDLSTMPKSLRDRIKQYESSNTQNLPQGIPAGSTLIGTSENGYPVYESADGKKRFEVTP